MSRLFAIVFLLSLLHWPPLSVAAEKRDSTARIEVLIARLVSKNARPKDPSEPHKDFNRNHHSDVLQAWNELRDLGTEAFPQIIEYLDDKQYSFTLESGSTDSNWTVGKACFDLLWCNLEPYNKCMLSSSIPSRKVWWRPVYTQEFLGSREKARDWIAKHKGKSLLELQIEVLEWVISHRSKRKVEISVDDRKHLVELLDELKKTKKPIEPAVPWSR